MNPPFFLKDNRILLEPVANKFTDTTKKHQLFNNFFGCYYIETYQFLLCSSKLDNNYKDIFLIYPFFQRTEFRVNHVANKFTGTTKKTNGCELNISLLFWIILSILLLQEFKSGWYIKGTPFLLLFFFLVSLILNLTFLIHNLLVFHDIISLRTMTCVVWMSQWKIQILMTISRFHLQVSKNFSIL